MRSLILAVALALATIFTGATGTYARSDTREETPRLPVGPLFNLEIFFKVDSELKTLSNVSSWIRNETPEERFYRWTHDLTLLAYFEGASSGQPQEGIDCTVAVLIGRAKDDQPMWGGKDISDGVFKKGRNGIYQFSFAKKKQKPLYHSAVWRRQESRVREALMGNVKEECRDYRYYLNPNPKLTSAEVRCRFDTQFRRGGMYGDHQFYTPPKDRNEKKLLAKSNPASCQTIAAKSKSKIVAKGKAREAYAALKSDAPKKKKRYSKR